MMKKKVLSLLLVLVMLFSITACGQKNTNSGSPNPTEVSSKTPDTESDSSDSTAALTPDPVPDSSDSTATLTPVPDSSDLLVTQYPVTVTDQAGRKVTIESEPQKLVSGYYISTSLLIALDLDDKLVGIEAKANKRSIYKLSAPELIDLPSVGTAKEFDLEGCLALEPDLVILPLKLKNTAETLEKLNIDVLYVNPESQELLNEMMTLIGTATNTQKETKALMDFITKHEATLQNVLANADTPKVYLAGNSNMLSTAGSAMYQSDMITLAGGQNVAAEITDTYWVEISYEQLLTWNPDYIILASDAAYTAEDVLSDKNLAECTAVKNGNVYQLPSDAESWDSPVPSGILGSIWIATVLHKDLFTADDANHIIDEYYETFYDFKYSKR